MSYFVKVFNLQTGKEVDCSDPISDPGIALEHAHVLHSKCGLGESVTIEDEDGNDKWEECTKIRCPSVGMFH
jgi:hypothetical protein